MLASLKQVLYLGKIFRASGSGACQKWWSPFKGGCHVGFYFWITAGYLKALEHGNGVPRPN